LLPDLRGGFASEAIGTLRSLHEAAQLLSTLSFHEEQDVLRRRLAGEYVRPAGCSAATSSKAGVADERVVVVKRGELLRARLFELVGGRRRAPIELLPAGA
jgi:hypothetical protein